MNSFKRNFYKLRTHRDTGWRASVFNCLQEDASLKSVDGVVFNEKSSPLGVYIIDFEIGTKTGEITSTFSAATLPKRFQIIYDGQIVADSLFIDGVNTSFNPSDITEIESYTSVNKYLYDNINQNFVLQAVPETVNFTSVDFAEDNGTEIRANGSGTGQLGVVEDYPNPSDYANYRDIKLSFNKNTASPENIQIKVYNLNDQPNNGQPSGVGGTWTISDIDSPISVPI